jgi:type IV fimbrial biogenesis protein FimT
MRNMRNQSGFTLVELIVTLMIVALIAIIAVPGFQGITRSATVESDATDLLNWVQLARGEAVKRGATVSLSAPNGWTQGKTIFVDDNANLVVDGGEIIVFQTTDKLKELSVGNAGTAGAMTDGIMFDPTGNVLKNPKDTTGSTTGGYLALQAKDGNYWASLCLNAVGRARVFRPKGGSKPTDLGCTTP